MSISTNTLGSAILAYRQSILSAAKDPNKQDDVSKSGSGNPIKASSTAVSSAASASTGGTSSAQTERVRQELDGLQAGIAQDLRAALQRKGLSLTGSVSFSVDANGHMNITGSAKDQASVNAALKADTSVPSLTSRIQALDQRVEAYDSQNTRNAAMSTAARYTGRGQSSNLLQLYQTFVDQNSGSSAVLSVSAKSSQLTFSGAVNTTA